MIFSVEAKLPRTRIRAAANRTLLGGSPPLLDGSSQPHSIPSHSSIFLEILSDSYLMGGYMTEEQTVQSKKLSNIKPGASETPNFSKYIFPFPTFKLENNTFLIQWVATFPLKVSRPIILPFLIPTPIIFLGSFSIHDIHHTGHSCFVFQGNGRREKDKRYII